MCIKQNKTGFWHLNADNFHENMKIAESFNCNTNENYRRMGKTGRILGCLHPLCVGDSICTSPIGTVGAYVASCDFLKYMLKHTDYDSYHFLRGANTTLDYQQTDTSEDELINYLNSQNVNPEKIVAYQLAQNLDLFKNTEYYAIHRLHPDLTGMANLRRTFKRLIAPMTGTTHTISYDSMMQTWLSLLFADVLPCDAIVCTSTTAQKVLKKTFEVLSDSLSKRLGCVPPVFRGRLEVIPLGVDTDFWIPRGSNDKSKIRKLLELPDDSCIILCVGRFSVQDKMDYTPLLIATKRLLDNFGEDSFRLVLVGNDCKSNYSFRLRKIIHKLGLSHVTRMETNVAQLALREYFGAADIFISLSDNLQETFGLTVIQAMASGLPVIASDWNGYRDTIVHGETGFRVRTYWANCDEEISALSFLNSTLTSQLYLAQSVAIDIDEVVKYLSLLLKEPELCKQLGNAGRKRAEELYSWPIIMKQYMSLWYNCRKIFEKIENYDSIVAKGNYPLNPSYFERFLCYATEILSPTTPVALTDMGFRLISNEKLIHRYIPCVEMGKAFSPTVFTKLVLKLASDIKIDLHSLVQYVSNETCAQPESTKRHIMWMIKYGLAKIAD